MALAFEEHAQFTLEKSEECAPYLCYVAGLLSLLELTEVLNRFESDFLDFILEALGQTWRLL